MVGLKFEAALTLGDAVQNWRRFVDKKVGYVKNGSIDTVLKKLDSFHPFTQFNYEVEKEQHHRNNILQ